MTTNLTLSFNDFPILIQEKIFKCLSYTELSRLRSVSKHFHRLCSQELNRGYFQLETIIHELHKQIKIKLPRRESERSKHPLSTKFDLVSNLDSRIQWLKLTFGSSIQNSLCCFYPGRLLDEIYSVLNHLKIQQTFVNPRLLLQETRDMSAMAIEHFREQIEPKFQQNRFASLTSLRANLSNFETRKRTNPNVLRRQIDLLNHRIYKQNLIIKSQKYQMKRYKHFLHLRSRFFKRLKSLEKKNKETEQILLEIRKDNDTLLQRFDQFILSQENNAKRRKLD